MDSTPFNMCFLSVTAAASTMVVSVVSKLSKVAKWTGHTGSFYHRSPSHRHNRSHNQSKCRNDVPTYSHNKQCKCLDPKAGSSCEDKCKFQNYKGDDNCNDENKWVLCRHCLDGRMLFVMCFTSTDKMPCVYASNCGCNYDGGDCCAKTVKGGTVKTKFWFVYSLLFHQTCVVTRWIHKCFVCVCWLFAVVLFAVCAWCVLCVFCVRVCALWIRVLCVFCVCACTVCCVCVCFLCVSCMCCVCTLCVLYECVLCACFVCACSVLCVFVVFFVFC